MRYIDRIPEQALEKLARLRPRNGVLGPLLGNGHDLNVELRPKNLPSVLQMLHDARRVRGGRRHHIAILRELCRRAVVHDEPVFAQHQSVARFSDRQRRKHIDVDAVEKYAGIRPLDIDLSERRHVADADAGANGTYFPRNGLLPVRLPARRKPLSTQPLAGLDESRAPLLCPVVPAREACRTEMLASMRT